MLVHQTPDMRFAVLAECLQLLYPFLSSVVLVHVLLLELGFFVEGKHQRLGLLVVLAFGFVNFFNFVHHSQNVLN